MTGRRESAKAGSTPPGTRVVLALGSNLGDRMAHLRQAIRWMSRSVARMRVSPVYASDPVGVEDQPEFLNAVMVGQTTLSPERLLDMMQEAEARAGRQRTLPGGPRTLDLDLVFYGDRVIHSERLDVPHPRWLERSFVRVPLAKVASDVVDPVSGRSVGDLSGAMPVQGVRWHAPPPSPEHMS